MSILGMWLVGRVNCAGLVGSARQWAGLNGQARDVACTVGKGQPSCPACERKCSLDRCLLRVSMWVSERAFALIHGHFQRATEA